MLGSSPPMRHELVSVYACVHRVCHCGAAAASACRACILICVHHRARQHRGCRRRRRCLAPFFTVSARLARMLDSLECIDLVVPLMCHWDRQ